MICLPWVPTVAADELLKGFDSYVTVHSRFPTF